MGRKIHRFDTGGNVIAGTDLSFRVARWLEAALRERASCRVSLISLSSGSEIHSVSATIGGEARSFILRRIVLADWIRREPDLVIREAAALRLARSLPFPTPRLVDCDPVGERTGLPAVLMTRIEGHCWPTGAYPGPGALAEMAQLLRIVHATKLEDAAGLPKYKPHHWPTILALHPPQWSRAPDMWRRAIALASGWRPLDDAGCLLHRDFRIENLLWNGDRVVGVVDWITACRGDPRSDVGHCRWNLYRGCGPDAMLAFSRAYGPQEEYHPLWDLLAAVGGLPDTIPRSEADAANLDAFVTRAVLAYRAFS